MSEASDLTKKQEENKIYVLNNLDNYIMDSRGRLFNINEEMLGKDYFYLTKDDLTEEGYQEIQQKILQRILQDKDNWEINKIGTDQIYKHKKSIKIMYRAGFTPAQNKRLEQELSQKVVKKETDTNKEVQLIFQRIKLPYPLNYLEPYISRDTMDNHYLILHRVYEENLNNILANIPEVKKKYPDLKDVVRNWAEFSPEIREKVRYNAGGLINHNFFFSLLANCQRDSEKSQISTHLFRTICQEFGTVENLKEKLIEKALEFTGTASYWTWLVLSKDEKTGAKKLVIINTLNQDNPWMIGLEPLLGIDLFEHAFFIDYRSNKRRYLKAVVNHCINWQFISELYLQKNI